MKYVRKAKTYLLYAHILQYFHLQRTFYRYLLNVVHIQLRLLLVQQCQTSPTGRISQCGLLGILNKLKPSNICPIVIAAFTSGIYKAEYPVFHRCLACQIGNMRRVMYI